MVAAYIRLDEGTAPGTPDTGEVLVYPKTDGKLYIKDDTGTETDLTAGGGGSGDISADTLTFNAGANLEIDGSGVITLTHARHLVDTAADAATDDLVTVNGLAAGEQAIISPESGARDIVIKTTGNIISYTGSQFTLDTADKYVLLYGTGSSVIAMPLFDAGGGGGGATFPSDEFVADEGANWTTTSTSMTEVDATDLSLTIITGGGDVLIGFAGSVAQSQGGRILFDVEIDGTDEAGDDGIFGTICSASAPGSNASFSYLKTGLSAGSHTFQLKWRVSSGTATMYAGAGTSQGDLHPQFFVVELG